MDKNKTLGPKPLTLLPQPKLTAKQKSDMLARVFGIDPTLAGQDTSPLLANPTPLPSDGGVDPAVADMARSLGAPGLQRGTPSLFPMSPFPQDDVLAGALSGIRQGAGPSVTPPQSTLSATDTSVSPLEGKSTQGRRNSFTAPIWTPTDAQYPFITAPPPGALPTAPTRDSRKEALGTGIGALMASLGLALTGNGAVIPQAASNYIQGSDAANNQADADSQKSYDDQVKQVLQRDQFNRRVADDQNSHTEYRLGLDSKANDMALNRQQKEEDSNSLTQWHADQIASQEKIAKDRLGVDGFKAANQFEATLRNALPDIAQMNPAQQAARLNEFKDLASTMGVAFSFPIPGEMGVDADGNPQVNPPVSLMAADNLRNTMAKKSDAQTIAIPIKTKQDQQRIGIQATNSATSAAAQRETQRNNGIVNAQRAADSEQRARFETSHQAMEGMKEDRLRTQDALRASGVPANPSGKMDELQIKINNIRSELGRSKPKEKWDSVYQHYIQPSPQSVSDWNKMQADAAESVNSLRRSMGELAPHAHRHRDPRNPNVFLPDQVPALSAIPGGGPQTGYSASSYSDSGPSGSLPRPKWVAPPAFSPAPQASVQNRHPQTGQYTQGKTPAAPMRPKQKPAPKNNAPVKTGTTINGWKVVGGK